MIIVFYDLILKSKSSELYKFKCGFKENYKKTDLGELSWCLGIHTTQARWLLNDRFCFQSGDWTTYLVCREAIYNYSILC